MSALTPERLAEIRERVEGASEGPWIHYTPNPRHSLSSSVLSEPLDSDPLAVSSEVAEGVAKRDGAFIAHARTDVPDLLAAVQRLGRLHQGQAEHIVGLRAEVERFRAGIEALAERFVNVLAKAAGVDLAALGVTKDGSPRHPLYLPGTARPTPWGQQ